MRLNRDKSSRGESEMKLNRGEGFWGEDEMKVDRSVGVLSDDLVYSARLVIVMQKSTCEKVSVKDYYRRLLQKTITEECRDFYSYALIESSIWEAFAAATSSILRFEGASLYFVCLINNHALR